MKYKENKKGDIVYTAEPHRWHDTEKGDGWHDIPINEAFRVEHFSEFESKKEPNKMIPHVRIYNIKEGYCVLMTTDNFYKRFNLKQIRKEKLQKLQNVERGSEI